MFEPRWATRRSTRLPAGLALLIADAVSYAENQVREALAATASAKSGHWVRALEHDVFCRNRDSQIGGFLIQASCWESGASMDDTTLF